MAGTNDFFSRLHFTWIHSRVFWTATSGGKRYTVDDRTYQRELTKRLTLLSIERRSWCTLILPYEKAIRARATNCWALWEEATRQWKTLCDAEEVIQRDLGFWATVPGVEVHDISTTGESNL